MQAAPAMRGMAMEMVGGACKLARLEEGRAAQPWRGSEGWKRCVCGGLRRRRSASLAAIQLHGVMPMVRFATSPRTGAGAFSAAADT